MLKLPSGNDTECWKRHVLRAGLESHRLSSEGFDRHDDTAGRIELESPSCDGGPRRIGS